MYAQEVDSVAQLVEQLTLNQWVVGSSPTGVTVNQSINPLNLIKMKTRTVYLFCALFLYTALTWGQTWNLSETMTAILDNNVMTISTTLEAEDMPERPWTNDECSLIHSLVIEEGVTSIGSWAFAHGANLTSVTIANSVTFIDSYGFYNCYNLPRITLPEGVTTLEHAAFKLCGSLTEIEISSSVSSIKGEMFTLCGKLEDIRVHKDNANFSSVDGILYNKDKTTVIIYPEGKNDATFEIPGTVATIYNGAFGNSRLETISIPRSVTTIEINAFAYSAQLTSLTIPNSVTVIGDYAFDHCTGLKEVTVEWDKPLSVPDNIFENVNTSAVTLYVPNDTKALYQETEPWKQFGTFEAYDFTGNEQIPAGSDATGRISAWTQNGTLYITGLQPGLPLCIYTVSGQLVYQVVAQSSTMNIPLPTRGVYIVTDGKNTLKINL